jgi:hypothetical protein
MVCSFMCSLRTYLSSGQLSEADDESSQTDLERPHHGYQVERAGNATRSQPAQPCLERGAHEGAYYQDRPGLGNMHKPNIDKTHVLAACMFST